MSCIQNMLFVCRASPLFLTL
uniref:Uncharacterized protein n=1 Tax=Anguilla anguilla TaxID=7936 RepID=A0A0E9QZL9_ANGAN